MGRHCRWFGDGLKGQVSKIADALSGDPEVAVKTNFCSNRAAGSESDRLAGMLHTAGVNVSHGEDIGRNPINIELANVSCKDATLNIGTCDECAADGRVGTNGLLVWPYADAGPIEEGA